MARQRKKSNKLLYILLATVALLIVIVIVGKSAGWIGKKKEMEVDTEKAAKNTIVEKVSASGAVQPETEVKLSPDVAGEIIELNVEEGDSVKAGQLLIKIRPDNLESALERTRAMLDQQRANLKSAQANLAKAEANFERASLEYKRNEKLQKEKVISKADWELAQSNFASAGSDLEAAKSSVSAAQFIVKSQEATVDEAAENLRLTNVYAPSGGIVSKLSVEKGERVVGSQMMSGTELLRIADLTKMEVRVDVNENDIIRVSTGDTAVIDVDSYASMDKKFKGIVTQIANTANDKVSADAVTEFEVRVRILNESYQDLLEERGITYPFRPGMTASVDIITNSKSDILTVPLSSVTTRDPNKKQRFSAGGSEGGNNSNDNKERTKTKEEDLKEVVFVNDNGVAKMIEVKTGISDFENIEILSGLEEGSEVVSGPFLAVSKRLNDGDAIATKKKNNKKEKKSEDKEE
ncbi:efflux RND transporter periplasmic adaptor subunit [Fulvivirgaceae bacterium BMA10]|uniref:Efflux RND transporter periplasmic adaptor subunit n=1 Tax=Splendidivirga corallicola TaxID=3051826 RepID=A0ABT8KH63_9BACT|nr:efflux RND transporter periplasmic adaptor subunit [Fulvivirgaceae bacterium BMA10]